MSDAPLHLLHLTGTDLRFAVVHPRRGRVGEQRCGNLAGEPAQTLEAWTRAQWTGAGRVALYDARPPYYAFTMHLPAGARAGLEGAVPLRVRQELGLGPEAVHASWRVRTEGDKLTVRVTVVRREALGDLEAWGAAQGIGGLWVGPDSAAIDALAEAAEAEPPLILDHTGHVIRAWLRGDDPEPERLAFATAGDPPPAIREALHRGPPWFFEDGDAPARPAWLPADAAPPLKLRMALDRIGVGEALQRFDAVIAGGLLEHVNAPPRGFLNREEPRPRLAVHLETSRRRRLTLACMALAVALLLAGAAVALTGAAARERLTQAARQVRPQIAELGERMDVLEAIQRERKPLTPVFAALLSALPNDMTLDSLRISESGSLQLSGRAKKPDAPNGFFKAVAELEPFVNVRLQEVKKDKQGVTFQLTAQVRDRARK